MPYHQIVDMECALETAGINHSLYKEITIPNSTQHAFEYWDTPIDDGALSYASVKDDVVQFLSFLKTP